jgi:Fe-S-cluster containining protein
VPQPNLQYNVKISIRTTLERLYTHDIDTSTLIEFPETSLDLFRMKPGTAWFNPACNFVYSRGDLCGLTGRKPAYCNVLVDTLGNKIVCF